MCIIQFRCFTPGFPDWIKVFWFQQWFHTRQSSNLAIELKKTVVFFYQNVLSILTNQFDERLFSELVTNTYAQSNACCSFYFCIWIHLFIWLIKCKIQKMIDFVRHFSPTLSLYACSSVHKQLFSIQILGIKVPSYRSSSSQFEMSTPLEKAKISDTLWIWHHLPKKRLSISTYFRRN